MNVKFTDLVYDVIVEEVKNKALVSALAKKWFGDVLGEEEIKKTESLIEWFTLVKSNLNPNTLEVSIFLHMFPNFEPKFLPDISKYTLQQIETLHDEFVEPANQQEDDSFLVAKSAKYNDKAGAASKKLWHSNYDLVFGDQDFKVHFVPDQKTSVRYGYYCEYVQKFFEGSTRNKPWCVAGRGGDSGTYTNMWKNYRDGHNRTFWFVIDESKNPETHPELDKKIAKYYLGALQYEKSRDYTGWRITSVLNDGDDQKSWEQIVQIYPSLAELDTNSPEFQEKFQWVRYSNIEDDTATKGELSDITEREGSEFEFCKQSIRIKKGWIVDEQPLVNPKSWKFLNTYLRNLYIQTTTKENMFNRWKSADFLEAVKSTPSFWGQLKNKMRDICDGSNDPSMFGHGIDILFRKLMEHKFKKVHDSIENSNLSIQESVDNGKVGIFNFETVDWHTINGHTYSAKYNDINTQTILMDDGRRFLCFTFSETNEVTPTSFFAFIPSHQQNKTANAHLIAYDKFKTLETRFAKTDDEDDDDEYGFKQMSDFDPENDTDIREGI